MKKRDFKVVSTLTVNDEVSVYTWEGLTYNQMWRFEKAGVDFLKRMVDLGEKFVSGELVADPSVMPRFTVTSHVKITDGDKDFYEGGGTWFDIPQMGVSYIKDALSKELPMREHVKKEKKPKKE